MSLGRSSLPGMIGSLSLPMSSSASTSTSAALAAAVTLPLSSKPTHVFTSEIAQMAVVFGERDLDDDVAQYIEDIVRAQLCEMVVQARLLAARRGAKALAVEDLIFLIRHNTVNVERLRSYLQWKDVRKRHKESDGDDELDNVEEPASERALKASKLQMQVPWDLNAIFGEFLPDDEDEEEDGSAAPALDEDSERRLKEFSTRTEKMTKEEYLEYAECRQASFIYRKSKKFRDFLSLGQTIDGALNDDVVDVLGFLAYEMVRALCDAGLANRRKLDLTKAHEAVAAFRQQRIDKLNEETAKPDGRGKKRSSDGESTQDREVETTPISGSATTTMMTNTRKRVRKNTGSEPGTPVREPPRTLVPPTSLFSEARGQPVVPPAATLSAIASSVTATKDGSYEKGAPPSLEEVVADKARLRMEDVNAGLMAMQRGQTNLKACGMRNWKTGVARLPSKFV